jgi:hypothetical protein
MFNIFGGKKDDSLVDIKNDASALRMHIHRIQEELATILEYKGRATKEERTTIVTSSLEAFNRVDTFLYQVARKTR